MEADPTTPDDPDAPGSKVDDLALISRVKGFIQRSKDHSAEWRDEAREAYDMVSGRQWSDDDAAILREQGRPQIVFNRIEPVIEAIAGSQVNNRQETKILPRSMEDDRPAEVATKLIDWARDQCDAEDEESDAFRDLLVCGMAWIETRQDYSESAGGKTVLERVDPLEMHWDPAARKRNLSDRREVARMRMWRHEDVCARWPDKEDEIEGMSDAEMRGQDAVVWYDPRDAYAKGQGVSGGPRNGRMHAIVHYQWCEDQPVYVVLNPMTGKREDVSAKDWALVKPRMAAMGLPAKAVKQSRRVWQHAFITGSVVLERGPAPCPFTDTFKCMTGKRDQNRGSFYGLLRAMRDPQRWANSWLSQSMHILATSAKSGWIAEESAIDDVRTFEESAAKAGSVTTVNDGALTGGRLREKIAAGMPAGFDRLLQFAIGSIPDVTGVNKEILGLADRDQPGVLEAQRKQAAQAILAPVFDSLRRYYKEQGRLMLHFIREYVPPDEAIRIIGDDGTPEMISTAELQDFAKYDVIVDEAPSSPNAKIEAWYAMQPLLPAVMKMPVPPAVWQEILKMSPIPASVADRLGQAMQPPPQQGPPPPDPHIVKAQMDAQTKQQASQLEAQTRTQDAQVRAQTDIQIAEIKAANERHIAEMRLHMEARLSQMEMAMQARQAEQAMVAGVVQH